MSVCASTFHPKHGSEEKMSTFGYRSSALLLSVSLAMLGGAAQAAAPKPPNKIGFIYMLQGGWDFSNLDPYATKPDGGKATITGPHVMVVGPGVKIAPGYDRTGNGVNAHIPYVMWKDTPYEHLMIPTR